MILCAECDPYGLKTQQILRLIFDLDNKVDDFKYDYSVGHCDSRELLLLWFM